MIRTLSLLVLSIALIAPATADAAKRKPIKFSLSKSGYTVVALANNGRAKSDDGKKISIVPPASTVTLQLIGPDGVYAGPIVVGKKGKKLVLGVKAGARLSSVKIRKGYAIAVVDPKSTLRSRVATATKKGAPIGAGVFGRVKAKGRGSSGDGKDRDLDGIPGAFDVDDDGDRLLDNFETGASASQAPPPSGQPVQPGDPAQPPQSQAAPTSFSIFSNLKAEIQDSLNANAAAVTDAQIDTLVSGKATLAIEVPAGDVELDCGALSYCSKGGSGLILSPGDKSTWPKFPDSVDSDNDGYGTISKGPSGDLQLFPAAKANEIGSGDAYIERIRRAGVETQLPGTLNYIFNTTPALTTYSIGGTSGTISYPVATGALGTLQNPIPVPAATPVTLTFWRPQRKAIEGSGEGTGFVDIGHLTYVADIPNDPSAPGALPAGSGSQGGRCKPADYTAGAGGGTVVGEGVVDGTDDAPADPAKTITFSVNLDGCLANTGKTWASGQVLSVDIQAKSNVGDNAAQKLFFKRT